jgi:predicted nucleic acid-binding protein
VKRLLADTGPIVALIDRSEGHHGWAREQFGALAPPLFTCEAVLAEATYLLRTAGLDPTAPLDLVTRGVLKVDFDLAAESTAIATLLRRYAPRMDLADGCLVRMSEIYRDAVVLTLDSDFQVYRRFGRQVVPTIHPG